MAVLRRIRLILLDVDGVLTDGTLIYTRSGESGKAFDVKDGYGIIQAQEFGLACGILTGKSSAIVRHRARELNIKEVHQGARDKEAVYERIIARRGLRDAEVAYIGDDEPDLPVLKRVGFSAAPADATHRVRRAVSYVCSRPGGRGAVREVIDLIMKAQHRRSG